jgi:hypothetical protein
MANPYSHMIRAVFLRMGARKLQTQKYCGEVSWLLDNYEDVALTRF